jgi:hypothetical protein
MIAQTEREAIATSGQQIFERLAAQGWRPEDDGKFVAIDVDSADFEIDSNDFWATERLRKRHPNARMWLARIGRKAAYRLGGRLEMKESQ